MIGKNFTFNGQAISTTTTDFRIGLDTVTWKQLDVSDEQQNVQWFHGVRLSPTFARGRRITLEGIIMADDQVWSSKAIDFLENLFALQGVPSQVELLPFLVTDEQERVWEIHCKIKEPLSIDIGDDDYLQGANRRWRVVLQSEDPRYYNANESTASGLEWYFGGVQLPVALWVPLSMEYNEIQVITIGNSDTPLKFTITAIGNIDAPLTIKNLSDDTFFGLNIDAIAGDVIVVDTTKKVATKNGVNILANRVAGSTWPKAKGTMLFSIVDEDGWLDASDFSVAVSWHDVLL